MKGFTLLCFAALLLLVIGFASCATAAQTNWPAAKAAERAERAERAKKRPAVEVRGNRLYVDRGDGKEPREFRCMFDIAERGKKHKAAKKGAVKK